MTPPPQKKKKKKKNCGVGTCAVKPACGFLLVRFLGQPSFHLILVNIAEDILIQEQRVVIQIG